MKYYIITTTKFADECLKYSTYGASQSNWLANVNLGDIIFLSQFNSKSQNLFGPFQVIKTLFYNKTIIYPHQRYFYRIKFKPIDETKCIEETDLYLNGVQLGNITNYFRTINLIQQNKHLHCICLTNDEGEAILDTFRQFGLDYNNSVQESELSGDLIDVNCKYIWDKNKLDKKHYFSSESDMESYIVFSLKNSESNEYKSLNKLLNKHQNNDLQSSEIYNQFIFGNAYPSDMVFLNKDNINVFELKKIELTNASIPQLEKEIKKHLYYSIYSNRMKVSSSIKRFNFYLICLKDSDNKQFKQLLFGKYSYLCKRINTLRENTITFVEYHVKDNTLFLEEV